MVRDYVICLKTWLAIYSVTLLTLKMTAADAVETSVTTINSLPQDFTNLDDQPSQTLTDTPGFKPFTLLRSLGRQSEQLAKNYIYYGSNVRCTTLVQPPL